MARLPQPGGDNGTWGDVLNDYLSQVHKADGTLKDNTVTASAIAPNTITGNEIQSGSITEAQLDTATQTKLNTTGSGNVADGTITTAKLHDGAVTDVKVASNAAIAQSKIADLTTDLAGKASASHTHTATDIADSTSTGRAVLTAADAAAARTAIGAGTSNLTLGTASTNAAAGNDARLSDERTPTDGSVTTGKLIDGAVSEVKLDGSVQAKLNQAAPTWSTISGKPTVVAAGADAVAARAAIDAPSVIQQGVPARVVMILDDQWASQVWGLGEAEKRGQKLNLAIWAGRPSGGSYMDRSQLRAAVMRGHGILLHSQNHLDMRSLDDATLVSDLETSVKYVSTLLNIDRANLDFVYPMSLHDSRTLSATYLRYRRQFAGPFDVEPWRTPFYRPKPHLCGRFNWASDRHQIVKDEIAAAAAANEDIVVYTHALDGSQTNGVTSAEFTDMLDHIMRLGMRMVHIDEFSKSPQLLTDPSFEDAGSFATNFTVTSAGSGTPTAEILTATPAATVQGSKVLHLRIVGSTSSNVIVEQRKRIPSSWFTEPNPCQAVLAARVKTALTGGSGGASMRIMFADSDGVAASGGQISSTYTGSDWSSPGAFKIAMDTYGSVYPYLIVQWRLVNASGDVWFDHAQLSVGTNDSFA